MKSHSIFKFKIETIESNLFYKMMNIQPTQRSSQPVNTNFVNIWSIEDQVKNLITQIESEIHSAGECLRPILNEASSLHSQIQQKVLTAHIRPVQSDDLQKFLERYNSIRQDFNAITARGTSNDFQKSSDMEMLSLSTRSSSTRSSHTSHFSQSTGEG